MLPLQRTTSFFGHFPPVAAAPQIPLANNAAKRALSGLTEDGESEKSFKARRLGPMELTADTLLTELIGMPQADKKKNNQAIADRLEKFRSSIGEDDYLAWLQLLPFFTLRGAFRLLFEKTSVTIASSTAQIRIQLSYLRGFYNPGDEKHRNCFKDLIKLLLRRHDTSAFTEMIYFGTNLIPELEGYCGAAVRNCSSANLFELMTLYSLPLLTPALKNRVYRRVIIEHSVLTQQPNWVHKLATQIIPMIKSRSNNILSVKEKEVISWWIAQLPTNAPEAFILFEQLVPFIDFSSLWTHYPLFKGKLDQEGCSFLSKLLLEWPQLTLGSGHCRQYQMSMENHEQQPLVVKALLAHYFPLAFSFPIFEGEQINQLTYKERVIFTYLGVIQTNILEQDVDPCLNWLVTAQPASAETNGKETLRLYLLRFQTILEITKMRSDFSPEFRTEFQKLIDKTMLLWKKDKHPKDGFDLIVLLGNMAKTTPSLFKDCPHSLDSLLSKAFEVATDVAKRTQLLCSIAFLANAEARIFDPASNDCHTFLLILASHLYEGNQALLAFEAISTLNSLYNLALPCNLSGNFLPPLLKRELQGRPL